jgi:hypothetical protein
MLAPGRSVKSHARRRLGRELVMLAPGRSVKSHARRRLGRELVMLAPGRSVKSHARRRLGREIASPRSQLANDCHFGASKSCLHVSRTELAFRPYRCYALWLKPAQK